MSGGGEEALTTEAIIYIHLKTRRFMTLDILRLNHIFGGRNVTCFIFHFGLHHFDFDN